MIEALLAEIESLMATETVRSRYVQLVRARECALALAESLHESTGA